MVYCMNDEDFYKELLSSFASSAQEKEETIKKHFADENYKDYQIAVHALKSSAKTIGANALSEEALKQENACKAGTIEEIKAGHEPLLNDYEKTVGIISVVLKPKIW